MPTERQWIAWALRRARAELGASIHRRKRPEEIMYAAKCLRKLRDAPEQGGVSWSRVNELGNADHYLLTRMIVFMCAGWFNTGAGAAMGRRSPALQLLFEAIRAAEQRLTDDDERPGTNLYGGRGSTYGGRGRAGRESRDPSTGEQVIQALAEADGYVRELGQATASVAGATLGVAALIVFIPGWQVLKLVPWLLDFHAVAGGGMTSDPGRRQVLWEGRGIQDALDDDIPYSWQWRDAPTFEEQAWPTLEELEANLPRGAERSGEAWGSGLWRAVGDLVD